MKAFRTVLKGDYVDTNTVCVFEELTESEMVDIVKRCKDGTMFLVHPQDVPGKGCPLDKDVSREEFEMNPAVKGVAIYRRTYDNSVIYE